MNFKEPNLKYKLKAVILDFKFDGLTQDDLIAVIASLGEDKKLDKIDSVLLLGIEKAISKIELNGLKETSEQWKNLKNSFQWTYAKQHDNKTVLIERLKECLNAISQDKIQIDDVCDILTEKEIDLDPKREIEFWSSKMNDCLALYQMVKGAIIIHKNRSSIAWSFNHTKDVYASGDQFPKSGEHIFKMGYETFKQFKRGQLGWDGRRTFTVLQVEALIRLFDSKKMNEITNEDVDKMIEDLTKKGYTIQYPKKKRGK